MLESRPPSSPGRAFGLGLIAGLILVDLGLLFLLIDSPITILSFFWGLLFLLSIPAIFSVGYWVANLPTARYYIQEGTLYIDWGPLRWTIPLGQIEAQYLGKDLGQIDRFRGLRWPGFMVGWGRVTYGAGPSLAAVVYATRPLGQQVVIVSGSRAFGLSPSDPAGFLAELELLQKNDLKQAPPEVNQMLGFMGWPIWADRPAQITIALAALLNAALFAMIAAIQAILPAEVVLHFDQLGLADRLGPPADLFLLPIIGLIAWILGTLFGFFFFHVREEKPMGTIIWGATVVIELATWVAVLFLLSGN